MIGYILYLFVLFQSCLHCSGLVELSSHDIRCLKTPAGLLPPTEDCKSSGTFPFPYGNEIKELWTFHYFRKKCFPFVHFGCIPRSPNWFYTENTCNEICGRYMGQPPESEEGESAPTNSTNYQRPKPNPVPATNPIKKKYQDTPAKNESSNQGEDKCNELPAFGSCVNFKQYNIVDRRWDQYNHDFMYTYRRGECVSFMYGNGNCGQNGNQFEDATTCENTCANTTEPCLQMPFSQGKNCSNPTGSLQIPSTRYTYNGGACVQFQFAGCGGTLNNFESLSECEKTCSNNESTQPRSTTRSPAWVFPPRNRPPQQ